MTQESAGFILEPRSLYLLTGPGRREWECSIPQTEATWYSITFRTVRDRLPPLRCLGKSEPKGTSLPRFGLHGHASAVRLNNFAADGQPDSRARNLAPVEALENAENTLVVLAFDAESVVGDRELHLSVT